MPRPQGTTALKSMVMSQRPATTQALVASARNMGKNLPSTRIRAAMQAGDSWQSTAWGFFDTCTEFHQAVTWVGNVLSKAKLVVYKDGTKVDPTKDAAAKAALDNLFGGVDNHSEMFRQFGLHLSVAGDCYVIYGPTGDEAVDEWLIAPASQTKFEQFGAGAQTWTIGGILKYQDPLAIRLWRPHPVNPLVSDAPTRAALPILSELDGLTKHIAAQIDSRLASAGILLLPSELSFAGTPSSSTTEGGETSPEENGASSLIQTLIDTASTAIANRDDASAVVPIIMQVAGEFVDKIKHLKFWSDLDKEAIKMRNEAIRRLSIGMDMPPEILEGTSDMNHWSSWQIEEAAIKVHTEPMLKIITGSLTTGYLRPFLEEIGAADADTYTLGYDDTDMRLRPNRSQEAIELHDRGALSSAAMLRETGFDVIDAMSEKERETWLLMKIASGSSTPNMVDAALKLLGVQLGVDPAQLTVSDSLDQPNMPTEARPTPSLKDHPTRELPESADSPKADDVALAASAHILVLRALERAGNRMKTKWATSTPTGIAARELYRFAVIQPNQLDFLLEDAWAWADGEAAACHAEPAVFRGALDSYTRMILVEQKQHDRAQLAAWLQQSALRAA